MSMMVSDSSVASLQLKQVKELLMKTAAQLEALQDREAGLRHEVGTAKGRLDLKEKVAEFLEQLQNKAHEKNVGAYRTLLTGLVQDLIPEAGEVEITLATERGLPALDLSMIRPDGAATSIMDGNGGALTNIICLGLRAIAITKSRTRQFMALDEGDCWIKPSLIGRFYDVIQQMSDAIGVQTLFIAHHDVSELSQGIALHRLESAEDGLVVHQDPNSEKWASPEQPGIRTIRLQNFMAHEDTTLELAPGVNGLLGENNIGKSVIMRALRSVAYGEVGDADIRHGEKRLDVWIDIENGLTVHFSREQRRSPVNMWAIINTESGEVLEKSGIRYEEGGRTPPEWVSVFLAMPTMEGLDIHLGHQKRPVFLLDDSASKRASVLNVGQESVHIQGMIAKHKEMCTRDAATVKKGEKELALVTANIEAASKILALEGQVAAAERLAASAEAATIQAEDARVKISAIRQRQEQVDGLTKRLAAFGNLPGQAPVLQDTNEMRRKLQSAKSMKITRAVAIQRLNLLQKMPAPFTPGSNLPAMRGHAAQLRSATETLARKRALRDQIASVNHIRPYAPADTGRIRGALQHASAAAQKAVKCRNEVQDRRDQFEASAQQLDEMLANAGVCPICNGTLDKLRNSLHAH